MFKCKLILSLLKTTPEQTNPSEAKGQKHHLIHHKAELHRYPCTRRQCELQWQEHALRCSSFMFGGCSGGLIQIWLTCHISQYLLVTSPISGMFSSLVYLHTAAINHKFQYCLGPTKQFFSTSSLKQTQSNGKCYRLKSQGLLEKKECGSLWFPYAQAWQCWLPQSHVDQKWFKLCCTLEKTTKYNTKILGWREVQYV